MSKFNIDPPQKPQEETEIHTQILRFQLGTDESRAYWQRAATGSPPTTQDAFTEQLFGAVSERRTAVIMRQMRHRYDAFPPALDVLSRWKSMTPATRSLICHWHLQLADPLYRAFTDAYLEERRLGPNPEIERAQVLRWVQRQQPERWSHNTLLTFASKLLSAAYSAGLIEKNRDPRPLIYPRVPDEALSYLLHLLRGVRFEGTLLDNPYLRSVGMSGKFLEDRLRLLPGLKIHRMGDLIDFTSDVQTLHDWSPTLFDSCEAL